MRPTGAGDEIAKPNEPLDWDAIAPRLANPIKVLIIEALGWIDQPLSAPDLTRVFNDDRLSLSRISHHLTSLAQVGALAQVRQQQVRGSVERLYFFASASLPR